MGAGLASQELLPGARIVRAFNAIGSARMGTAYQNPGKVGMPIASVSLFAFASIVGGMVLGGRALKRRLATVGSTGA